MFKRICLFLGLNILIVASVSILCDLVGLRPYINRSGLDLTSLAIFCLIWGMVGSFISLLLSKKIAKWMLSVRIISNNANQTDMERNLCSMVQKLSIKARLMSVPEVGIFENAQCNAFATGASKKSALIAVSSGLLHTLSDSELEAVLAHEMTHITNGDMVTMTLLQGVINSFVMFLSRVCAYALVNAGRDNNRRASNGISFYLFTILFEMIFLSLGSLLIFFVSRKREYAADKGAARLTSKEQMIDALKALDLSQKMTKKEWEKQKSFAAMMIKPTKKVTFSRLFATHPTIEERIAYLESLSERYFSTDSYTRNPI
ncbi:MAG: Protease HtpX [Chlamydiia bacterium]|nr:Protease HtpX [Chlamydiia bacterium]MCH9618856.1 Protease HtpX [Chlamydiia bacterium]MCH9624543.1 Protease HtpX [Chlamydiia bacterium]